ncbi:hypothetical protein [Sphingorhabdus sp.]|jgi:hypothetical protein|uniref:hypothetical protein n=1 Tax=Sphingorhabdus sp. TaxID=1902408 RepID=UPI003BB1F947|nr:CTP synthetase [Sphingomonadales bacterium]MBK9433309.1 CTP synthetase [Sphingomonadales bacterium]
MESRLMFALFFVVATTLMGSAIVAVLTVNMGTSKPIMLAAAAGFVLAIPVTWFISHRIIKFRK